MMMMPCWTLETSGMQRGQPESLERTRMTALPKPQFSFVLH